MTQRRGASQIFRITQLRIPRLLAPLKVRWEQYLVRALEHRHAGYIGHIPYLVCLRLLIVTAVLLRFYLLHWRVLPDTGFTAPAVLMRGAVAALVLETIVLVYASRPSLARTRAARIATYVSIPVDIAIFSVTYYLTNKPTSDFALFYYLPLLTATEFLSVAMLPIVASVVCACLLGTLLQMPGDFRDNLVIWLMRSTFLVSVAAVSAVLNRLSATQHTSLRRQQQVRQELLQFHNRLSHAFVMAEIPKHTLAAAQKIMAITEGSAEVGTAIYFANPELVELDTTTVATPDCVPIANEVFEELSRKTMGSSIAELCTTESATLLAAPLQSYGVFMGLLCAIVPRETLFSTESRSSLHSIAQITASAIARERRTRIFHETSSSADAIYEADALLQWALRDVLEKLHAEFAAISAIDTYTSSVGIVRAINVPPGWINRSRVSLAASTIYPEIIRKGVGEFISGWDERLDQELYSQYAHSELARLFAPMKDSSGATVGVFEVGCHISRQSEVFTAEAMEYVRTFARFLGAPLYLLQPYTLLRSVGHKAMELIGADSATLHIYSGENVEIEAAVGRAEENSFLVRFPPASDGIGARARVTWRYQKVDDPVAFAAEYPQLHAEGIRAIAAFPLALGSNTGVLYVHFWRERGPISGDELELEQSAVRLMEVAIRNSQLVSRAADSAKMAWMTSSLQRVIATLAANQELDAMLPELVQAILSYLAADSVVLYEYRAARQEFLPPVFKGVIYSFASPALLESAACWELLKGGRNWFDREATTADHARGGFVHRERLRSRAGVIIRAHVAAEPVGVLFVNYRTPQEFRREAEQAISAVAASVAIAISSGRLHEQAERRHRRWRVELDSLSKIDNLIASSLSRPNRDEVLRLVLQHAIMLTAAEEEVRPDGSILLVNRASATLEVFCHEGFDGIILPAQRIGEGIIGKAVEDKASMLIGDVLREPWKGRYLCVKPTTVSELAVPLKDDEEIFGVINLEHPKPHFFDVDHQALVETLALQAVIAFRSIELYEEQRGIISAVTAITSKLQGYRYDTGTELRLILTGITANDGLGFTRALLFVFDETGSGFRGRAAVGPVDATEASRVWRDASKWTDIAQSMGRSTLEHLLDLATQFRPPEEGASGSETLNELVSHVEYSFVGGLDPLLSSVVGNAPSTISLELSHPLRQLLGKADFPADEQVGVFPLKTEAGKRLGFIVVDRAFQTQRLSALSGDVRTIAPFAALAELSLLQEAARETLSDEYKLAQWHLSVAEILHTLRGQIAGIREYTANVRYGRKVGTVSDGEIDEFIEHIRGKNVDLLKTVERIRDFARPVRAIERIELGELVCRAIKAFRLQYNVNVQVVVEDQPIFMMGDPDRLTEALYDLMTNALEAFEGEKGALLISVVLSWSAGQHREEFAKLEIADNCGGISPDIRPLVFTRYCSTKKEKGRGLGLAIVDKIVKGHGGSIVILRTDGSGTSFRICLPASRQVKGGRSADDFARG